MTGIKYKVLTVIWSLSLRKVAIYGQATELVGSPGVARRVGHVLRSKGLMQGVPWERVINASGGISTYKLVIGELQKGILKIEGVFFDGETVNLDEWQWIPD